MQDTGGLRYFTWDRNGMNLLCERDASGTVVRRYTHGPTAIDGIGSVVEMEDVAGSTFKCPHTDHRGTVFATTDAGETVKDSYLYSAYGQDYGATESGFANRFRYQSNWIALPDSGGQLVLSPTRLYAAPPENPQATG